MRSVHGTAIRRIGRVAFRLYHVGIGSAQEQEAGQLIATPAFPLYAPV